MTKSQLKTGLYLTGLTVALLLTAGSSLAQETAPRFASAFSDHAVLQRGEPVHIWGTAAPSHALTLTLNDQSTSITSDAKGAWSAQLPALTPGGPYTLSIADSDGAKTALRDIMVGDVYLCGGQSNMEFPARLGTGAWGDIDASANANIRFITLQHDSQALPVSEIKQPAVWQVAGPKTTGEASAICYHMAQTLQKEQNVPVGFIGSYWGGTTIHGWISAPALRTLPDYTADVDRVVTYGQSPREGMAQQAKLQQDWWGSHDPDAKTSRAYIAPDFDDSAWPSMIPSGSWKESGIEALKDFDGVVWLRTDVTLTAEQAQTANDIALGPIDTYDTTWINGVWVGSTSISWMWRDYPVPSGIFKAGKNTIVVRALGSGGMTGTPQSRVINTSDGQTIALPESWTYKTCLKANGLTPPATPWSPPTSYTTLYNGMIAPISGYTIKLAAWYQGESNADDAAGYRVLLPLLMKDWRTAFNKPKLPFLVAQLASYGSVATEPGKSGWAELREAQRLSVDADANSALIVTMDIGDRTDIHPSQKTVVGKRFARAARHVAYGETISPSGPEVTGITRTGADLLISFKDTQGKLLTYSSDQAIGFEACAAPDSCTYWPAQVKGDQIVLPGANNPQITSVRYAWADAPFVNLFSADDQPVIPFEMKISN
ncbi:MAG: sialate O-acetylesterase [Asticcacaulis sp.]